LPQAYDILRALIPSYRSKHAFDTDTFTNELELSQVDPRLWAVIIQVLTQLPDALRVYPIALADKHLPQLQRIPSTPDFSFVTVLELPACAHLTDDTILELKQLHALCALDASQTLVTAQGIRRLCGTQTFAAENEGIDMASRRRGPWSLRILRLRNCQGVTNKIFDVISGFPLLSVLGTLLTDSGSP